MPRSTSKIGRKNGQKAVPFRVLRASALGRPRGVRGHNDAANSSRDGTFIRSEQAGPCVMDRNMMWIV
jgi:hypothetical protein